MRWPYTDGRPFGLVAGWVAMELTKNVAEMARTRTLHRATQPTQRHGGGAPGS